MAPGLAGLFVIVLSLRRTHALSLSIAALAAATTQALLVWTSAAWSFDPPSAAFSHRSLPSVLAIGLSLAALHAPKDKDGRRASRAMVLVALLCAGTYLGWPWPQEALVSSLARVFTGVTSHPTPAAAINFLPVALIAGWPLVTVVSAGLALRESQQPARTLVATLILWGCPALLAPSALGALTGVREGLVEFAPTIGEVAALGGNLVVVAFTASFLATWSKSRAPGPLLWGSRPVRTHLLWAGFAVLAVTFASLLTSVPSDRTASWQPSPPTVAGDRLFGDLLPRWNENDAPDLLEGERRIGELVTAARSLDLRLGLAVETLVRATDRDDLTVRRWERLTAAVNAASRAASLPYYVDPTGAVVDPAKAHRQRLRLDTYRIEHTGRFVVQGRPYAALHVRWMTPWRGRFRTLGLSRDAQPFAVVVLDEIDAYVADLGALASMTPPRCTHGHGLTAILEEARRRCGDLLAEANSNDDLRRLLLAAVERHELQHQIDGSSLGIAAVVDRGMGRQSYQAESRVNRELSAYLAQMTTPKSRARLTLARLMRFTVLERSGTERSVAILALEALVGRRLDRGDEGLTRGFLELSDLSEEALRERARAAYRAEYGKDVAIAELP